MAGARHSLLEEPLEWRAGRDRDEHYQRGRMAALCRQCDAGHAGGDDYGSRTQAGYP
jgi:hypothetical protein